jgi:hypothetical protein
MSWTDRARTFLFSRCPRKPDFSTVTAKFPFKKLAQDAIAASRVGP